MTQSQRVQSDYDKTEIAVLGFGFLVKTEPTTPLNNADRGRSIYGIRRSCLRALRYFNLYEKETVKWRNYRAN